MGRELGTDASTVQRWIRKDDGGSVCCLVCVVAADELLQGLKTWHGGAPRSGMDYYSIFDGFSYDATPLPPFPEGSSIRYDRIARECARPLFLEYADATLAKSILPTANTRGAPAGSLAWEELAAG
jgi:hypothetical protein